MNTALVFGIAALFVLALLFLFTTLSRRESTRAIGFLNRETRTRDKGNPLEHAGDAGFRTGREIEKAAVLERRGGQLVPVDPAPAPVPALPMDADAIDVTRRQFLNRGIVTLMALSTAAFAAASMVGFLWPPPAVGFGGKIKAGKLSDILAGIAANKEPMYVAEARTYLSAYPPDEIEKAKKVYAASLLPGMESGLVALYQRCVHLGCRVPWCKSSQWFECPCHGSKYNRVGEKKGGPAPRGLDRFPIDVVGGTVAIDTGSRILGPAIGTNTTGQEAEGPHCA
ncbi:MAG TPA: Rieske 2Fe-2S domain-containing protein [Acidimicrobiales bacterium]|nr:Rieske 2Fe-2S domain-containing protein [Acidimicrobiales bacterium]